MPKKTVTNETVAAVPAHAAKPKATRAAAPRVKTVKHSKAAAPPVAHTESVSAEVEQMNAHEAIAKIAYGYWVARRFQSGSPEQDWLRAEQEYLLQA